MGRHVPGLQFTKMEMMARLIGLWRSGARPLASFPPCRNINVPRERCFWGFEEPGFPRRQVAKVSRDLANLIRWDLGTEADGISMIPWTGMSRGVEFRLTDLY